MFLGDPDSLTVAQIVKPRLGILFVNVPTEMVHHGGTLEIPAEIFGQTVDHLAHLVVLVTRVWTVATARHYKLLLVWKRRAGGGGIQIMNLWELRKRGKAGFVKGE